MIPKISEIEIEANQRAVERYISIGRLSDVEILMEGVRSFISWFKNENCETIDGIFIDRFPKKLYDEFVRIKDDGNAVEGYSEKKILLFDVFTFVFRNRHLLWEFETKPFIDLFLSLIQNKDDTRAYDPSSLIKSIIICARNPSNNAAFIKSNCMFHFYRTFKEWDILDIEFWDMCKEVYEREISHISFYFCERIINCLEQIMSTFLKTPNVDMARLLLIVFDMLHHQKLIDKIRFDLESFFSITDWVINNYSSNENYPAMLKNLSIIWSDILNKYPISFQIDDIKKLTILAGLVSIMYCDVTTILFVRLVFEDIRNKTNNLYIIYLALVAINQCDTNSRSWLIDMLKGLHKKFQEYLEKDLILGLSLENQFLILQYYIKSSVTLKIHLSHSDYHVINTFLDSALTCLHRLFLISQILSQSLDSNLSNESYPSDLSLKILGFMKDLTLVLSDDMYIQKLLKEKQLFMYEYIKTHCLSNIDVDFITNVFSRCTSDMTEDSQHWIPQKLGLSEYKIHNHIFGFILNQFNIATYFEKRDRDHFMKWCLGDYTNLSEIPNNHEQFALLSVLKNVHRTPR
ncbi:hypothetical protein RF11_08057 [Thelohanellus kitauei]|uniref:Uncharacterized protein n=1 Tax=Thelohanellus kitauei TaxID=669202 RepID=A0A0C2J385_THEKT|nr:hypothetical protein RF11_08057 [Thelohanellus kitauei]